MILLPRRKFLVGAASLAAMRAGAFAVPPNDPSYAAQWQLAQINIEAAWKIHQGTSATVIALLDTGYTASSEAAINQVAGYNEVAGAATPTMDGYTATQAQGHGSIVASAMIAATGNAFGIAGISPNATLMPIVVCQSNGVCNENPIAAGIDFAWQNGAHIINMSFVDGGTGSNITPALARAWDAGCSLVAITGNTGTSVPNQLPASLPNVIGVGSVTQGDVLAANSTTGCVKVVAPGGLNNAATQCANLWGADDQIATVRCGTSFAAPDVSATLADMRTANSRYTFLRNDEMNLLLFKYGLDLINGIAGYPTIDASYGYGRLNAGKAVQAAYDYVRPFPVRALPVGGL